MRTFLGKNEHIGHDFVENLPVYRSHRLLRSHVGTRIYEIITQHPIRSAQNQKAEWHFCKRNDDKKSN